MRKLKVLLAVILLSSISLSAQDNKVLDGVFIKETAPTKRVVPYTHVREADVTYYKRVYRTIDLKQKINHPLYYPLSPIREIGYVRLGLIDVIKQAIGEGTLTAYEDESFQNAYTKSEAEGKMSEEVTVMNEDPETGEFSETSSLDPITPDRIVQYRLKEDWFFDRERSVMEVRIIGVQPIFEQRDENGDYKGISDMFWIYFPEARYVFANHEVYNANNDVARITYEDYFRKRIFGSFIHQETNVYDNRILDDYTNNVDLLLEARRIEGEIINYEHDMWQY